MRSALQVEEPATVQSNLAPLELLTDMIRAGWGGVRRDKIPDNWREIPGPELTHAKMGRKLGGKNRRKPMQYAVSEWPGSVRGALRG